METLVWRLKIAGGWGWVKGRKMAGEVRARASRETSGVGFVQDVNHDHGSGDGVLSDVPHELSVLCTPCLQVNHTD